MSSVSSRTAFVLLASLEDELRSIVENFSDDEIENIPVSEDVSTKIRNRRKRDGLTPDFGSPAQMLPYIDFEESYQLACQVKDRLPSDLAEGLGGLGNRIGKITGVRNRVAHNRPLHVDDLPLVADFARDLTRIQGWPWQELSETLSELVSDPSYVFEARPSLVVDPDTSIAHNLPIPDYDETSLLGRREERGRLVRALRGAWPVVSVLGDGGIGKTALALQVCYDLLEDSKCRFEAIVWVTAKNAQLTSSEIVRIETSVEDSLGLFASAVAALGGSNDSESAIDDLLEVLEAFPTLLVLDNVETVLDENFPVLLRDIPLGSKILITSRIGVKTENPLQLSGLSVDDAVVLLRSLARARGIELPADRDGVDLRNWVSRMNCHPAYIKWFVAGLQAGELPEKLLDENGLVLDYCMSNVFRFLSATARSALQAMLVVPGSHTMAELAYLADLDAEMVQQVVYELTRTNFVTQVRSGGTGTGLELSDFARAYLRRTLSVEAEMRRVLMDRQKWLYELGGGLRAAHESNPYSADTVDVRGVGDYSAAKHLREALEMAHSERYDEALRLCSEAGELAPGYHEAARVEARVHFLATNFGEANDSYSRACDLAPENPYVAYEYGCFLVQSGFGIARGVGELQRAARLDDNPIVHHEIAESHILNGDYRSAIDASAYAVSRALDDGASATALVFSLWRATAFCVQVLESSSNWEAVPEVVEFTVQAMAAVPEAQVDAKSLDLVLWVEGMLERASSEIADDYVASRAVALVGEVKALRSRSNAEHLVRRVGHVKKVVDRGFGFVADGVGEYFFHARRMWNQEFDSLRPGSVLAFTPSSKGNPRDGKPEADEVHWIG